MNPYDTIRELEKIYDVMRRVDNHMQAEALMNAELHMSDTVRPAPLASAVAVATLSLEELIARLEAS